MATTHFSGPIIADGSMPVAPVMYSDDFLIGAAGLATIPATGSEENGYDWIKLIVGVGPPTVGYVADGQNGQVQLAMEATDQAQDAVFYHGDQKNFDTSLEGQLIFRAKFSVLPTTGVTVVAGLSGNHNLDKDTVTEHAWFRWQASAVLLTETDDTTNDNDDTATGLTTIISTWNTYRIDFTTQSSVKFYVDDSQVSGATTFDMSNLSASESIMQPYFSLDKASGVGVGTMEIDYVWWWSQRA